MLFHTLFVFGENMYKKISHKITSKFIEFGIIKSSDYSIYRYGFELLVSLIFTIAFILIVSAMLNKIIETLFFLIAFLGTRTICGGYHAKHYYSCFFGTISIYFFSLLFYCYIYTKHYADLILFPFTIISALIIVLCSPVEHPNNPMTTYRKNKNRLIGLFLSIIICLMHFFVLFIEHNMTQHLSFFIGFIFAAFTVLVAKIEMIILERKEKLK